MSYEDNLDEVLASYDREFPQEEHTLEHSNAMEYARYLQDREGYYIFNDSHAMKMVRKQLAKVIAAGMSLSDRNVKLSLEAAGYEEINFLRSHTATMRPPIKEGEGPRAAHPGGWSDITGNLAAAYRHSVDGSEVQATVMTAVNIPSPSRAPFR